MIRNRLNRKNNHTSDFSDFYLSNYGNFWSFLWRHHPNFRWIFHDNSKNKNWRIFLLFFPYYMAHSHKNRIKTEGEGGCISLVGKSPGFFYRSMRYFYRSMRFFYRSMRFFFRWMRFRYIYRSFIPALFQTLGIYKTLVRMHIWIWLVQEFM